MDKDTIQKDLDSLDQKLEEADKKDTEALREESTETPTEEVKVDETKPDETTQESEEVETKEETKEEEKKDYLDPNTLYKESTKEAQRLANDQKIIDEAMHQAHNIKITDEDLKTEYPEWDMMSDLEKKLATDNLLNKKKFELIDQAAEERRVVDTWNEKVDEYAENPQTLNHNPDLEGKTEAFKAYAKQKGNRNVSLNVLTNAFLFEESKKNVKHTGKMFETGTGGDKTPIKPQDKKLSVEESAKLMKSDYKKFMQELKAGRVATEVA